MEIIKVTGLSGESQVIIGELLENIGSYLPKTKVFIITDENVKAYHGDKFPDLPTYCVEPGEVSKSLEVAGELYYWLLEMGADRKSFILGIGGGVVCDLAGFVASTFMRGVDFGFVATSLLAQVDASVGGKNGVNISGYKNIVGTFNQPKFVICDIQLLKTLPHEEYLNGFAEIVKHTLIADSEMFKFIEENIDALKVYNPILLEKLVIHSAKIKASIVQADEREKGERKKLNLGHTWGHAVERETGMSHGKSVSVGMEFSARFSIKKGLLEKRDYMRLLNILRELELPICIKVNPRRIFEALSKDKKKNGDAIDFIFMKGIGNVKVERIALDKIKEFIEIG
ncbi:MAG: 3-dehydroquinate synthase [Bacteroidales bacterium]|jgi:3-dehydroquinate synthase|nr:3-dehydroquinate synthase [Bacteroidales bacterium]MDD4385138.1 3-dehydroquinate synthase [Bacteroidales bacterium]MDY0198998.1 3-dehydroquinate synthase [Tenuifilaceae bacterium]